MLRSLFLCGLLMSVGIGTATAQSQPQAFRYRISFESGDLPIAQLDASNPYDLASADIDGNGFIDCALIQRNGQPSYYLSYGKGRFSGARSVPMPAVGSYQRLAFADLDGDGLDDLLASGSPGAWVLRSLGGAGFAAPLELVGSNNIGSGGVFAGADIDGDGDGDVIAGIRVYRQVAPWTFVEDPGARITSPFGAATLADLDGDGDPDLASVLDVRLNDGTGRWTTPPTPTYLPAPPSASSRAPLAASFRGGSILDLLFLDSLGQVRYFEGAGNGTWIDRTSRTAWPVERFTSMHASDFDRDGRVDVLLVATSTLYRGEHRTQVLMRNRGGGVFADESATMLPHAESRGGEAVLGDWNGDGASEVLLIGEFWITRLFWNDGAGRLLLPQGSPVPWGLPEAFHSTTADLDGDGAKEILLADGRIRLLSNDGWGRFQDQGTARLPLPSSACCYSTSIADVDGDGRLDVIAACERQSRVYRNLGGLRFADETATRFPALFDATRHVLVLDVDGDGDPDLYLLNTCCSGSFVDRLLINQGMGIFASAPPNSLPVIPARSLTAETGDFDRDGDPDLFLASYDRERLLLNDGQGSFSVAPTSALPSTPYGAVDIEVGDLDRDGDLDLYILRPSWWEPGPPTIEHGGSAVYLNDGSGRFSLLQGAVPFSYATREVFTVQLYDLDGDGHLDAVEARGEFSRVLRNSGRGIFGRILEGGRSLSMDRIPVRSFQNTGILAGDWDRDQDADLLVLYRNGNGGDSTPLMLQGAQRQLFLASPPFIGRDIELGIWHEANVAAGGGSWIPFISAGRAVGGIPLPPFGTFGLDLLGFNALPPRPLVRGQSRSWIDLPADPTLPQQWIHFQALFLPSPTIESWRLSSVVSAVAVL